jgi:hypothetical protein
LWGEISNSGVKKVIFEKNVHFPPPDHCAPEITKIRYDPRRHQNFF